MDTLNADKIRVAKDILDELWDYYDKLQESSIYDSPRYWTLQNRKAAISEVMCIVLSNY